MNPHDHPYPCGRRAPKGISRRDLLIGAGVVAAAGLAGVPLVKKLWREPHAVFLAKNQRYDGPLVQTIEDGLEAVGFDRAWIRGRKVLLKPNLVEPFRGAPQMTTNPAMVLAAADVFRRLGAEVQVGEGPGHVRDTEMALVESGMDEALQTERLKFLDVNYSEVRYVPNRGGFSALTHIAFPAAVIDADLVVSMPKFKTHHWMGVTASMKNLYGTLPGIIYGWPKNVLHYAGIPETVVDIQASLPQTMAIIDGILCMEGDGPILGTPKPMGLVAVALNPTAVDATLARIAGFDPAKVPYLKLADGRLGPIAAKRIVQRGERWEELVSPFTFVDVEHLRNMRAIQADEP